jgi:hypothetical protein
MVRNNEAVQSISVSQSVSQSQPPTLQLFSNVNASAGSSHPLNKKFREIPTNVPINKGKHKSPDDDGAVEEDVQHMEREETRFDAPHIIFATHFLLMTPSFTCTMQDPQDQADL